MYIVKEVKKEFKKLKRHNFKTRFAFKAKRLSSYSNLKDPIKKEHLPNVVYEIECPDCDKKVYWRNWEKNCRAVQGTRWKRSQHTLWNQDIQTTYFKI